VKSYRVQFSVVYVNLDFLDILEFEVEILYFPLLSAALRRGLDGHDVSYGRPARATPPVAAAQQRLGQIVEVEWITHAVSVRGSHRQRVLVHRR